MKNFITKNLSKIGSALSNRSSGIAIGLGITGVAISSFFMGYNTPAFKEKLKKEKEKEKKLPVKTVAKETVKTYGLPFITFVASSASISKGLYNINQKTITLSTAAVVSENTTKEVIEKLKKEFGDEKVEKVKEEVSKNGVSMFPGQIVKNQRYLFEDRYTGKRFITTYRAIEKAFDSCSKDIILDNYCRVCDLYSYIMSYDQRAEIDIPQVANANGWGIEDAPTGEINWSIDPIYYPETDEIILNIRYQAPCEDYDKY